MIPEAWSSDSNPPMPAVHKRPPSWENLYAMLGLDVDRDAQAEGIRRRLESAIVSGTHWCGPRDELVAVHIDGPHGLVAMIERRSRMKRLENRGVLLNVNGLCAHRIW